MPAPRPFRRTAAPVALLLALTGAAACGGGGGDTDASGSESDAAEVVVRLVAFRPETVEVRAGQAVTWSQRDTGDHTVTSGEVLQEAAGVTPRPDGRFDSGALADGGTFTHTFGDPGTYPYFCELHPATMRGVVRVI